MKLKVVRLSLALLTAPVAAQSYRTVTEGRIGPYQTITTSRFAVQEAEGIAVDVLGPARLGQAVVSAFDSTPQLMEKQGAEESGVAEFRWIPTSAGQYYLQIRNVTAKDASYTVRLISDQISRGEPEKNYAEVQVFFATNRNRSGKDFGSERVRGQQLHYGVARVSIPRDHRLGGLEEVHRLFRMEPNPSKEVAVLGLGEQPRAEFFHAVRQRVLPSEKRSALVFIHGFNVHFEEAIRRMAQIAYDLHYDGAPVAFSWPSAGQLSLVSYNRDGDLAELSIPALEDFLMQIQQESGAGSLQIIAHSMGNRILLRALKEIATRQPAGKRSLRVSEIIFMAPDVEAEVFTGLSSAVRPLGSRFTLYASDNDFPLWASQALHGARRAGQGGANTLVIEGIDSIDASKVKTDLLGHGYYGDSTSILFDLDQLFQGRPASKRLGLREARNSQGLYWEFTATAH
jgi:esterase/lipase superfamily enzyme